MMSEITIEEARQRAFEASDRAQAAQIAYAEEEARRDEAQGDVDD